MIIGRESHVIVSVYIRSCYVILTSSFLCVVPVYYCENKRYSEHFVKALFKSIKRASVPEKFERIDITNIHELLATQACIHIVSNLLYVRNEICTFEIHYSTRFKLFQ